MLKKTITIGIATVLLWASVSVCEAGLQMSTRVIFSGKKKEASLHIRNPDNIAYLVQTWIDYPQSSKSELPFFVTPPLSRLAPDEANTLRIIKTKQTLPQDRETLYWLNVKAIPSVKPMGNEVVLAVKTQMKLIYRPSEIKGNPQEAASKLTWRRAGNKIEVQNPTPFYYTFYKVMLGEQELKASMVAPFSGINVETTISEVAKANTIKWQYITDYGNNSEWITVSL